MATTALALIGLFNVFGTYVAGSLGSRLPKRYLLSAIYALRSLAIVAFLLAPLTPLERLPVRLRRWACCGCRPCR